jgi:hypothetical protein
VREVFLVPVADVFKQVAVRYQVQSSTSSMIAMTVRMMGNLTPKIAVISSLGGFYPPSPEH